MKVQWLGKNYEAKHLTDRTFDRLLKSNPQTSISLDGEDGSKVQAPIGEVWVYQELPDIKIH